MLRAGLILLLVAGVTGCGTDYDGTRDDATEQAVSFAYALRGGLEEFVSSGRAPRGERLLEVLHADYTDGPGVVGSFGGDVLDDGSVRWKVALDGEAQNGGGGSYHQFQARVCVEYVVGRTYEPHVTMTDTECDPTFVEGSGPISAPDAVVTLEEGGGDPGPPATTRRVCQERSGGDSDCPGG